MRAGAEPKCLKTNEMPKPAKSASRHPLEPDVSHLITEDDTPMDNPFQERQQRLMPECIQTSYQPGRPFVCFANVGLYPSPHVDALVPDMMLSLDVSLPEDIWEKGNRAYLVWRYGKPPDLVVEVVSNRKGGEATKKLERYASMRVAYYAIYDPKGKLSKKRPLRLFELRGGQYVELLDPTQPLEQLGLKLVLWDGIFQDLQARWLRFADLEDHLLLTGGEMLALEREKISTAEEAAKKAQARAEQAEGEKERLKARLLALGVDPDSV